ncbi:MAG: DUF3320 domain-containing protein [Bacteroidetes bacterium]|nr:DUF3320 domain-containing protein [Bacteroidota bacterium]
MKYEEENGQAPQGWEQAIGFLKERLIDTSKRNRLINSPVGKKRGKHLDIVDERSDEIFKLLVRKGKKMQFEHAEDGYEEPEEMQDIFVPDPDPPDARHLDLKLQTCLTKDALHKRLLQLYRDSNSAVEEQGYNPLYLALGFVRWFESASSKVERFAPLVLLPVELQREGVRANFKLFTRDQDLEPNHSFDALLKSDYDLKLPEWPEGEDWIPSEYFGQVNDTIGARERWMVWADTMQLGFYSSGKFLMSRDLDRAEPAELMQQLLYEGFGSASPLFDPEENLDERYVDPKDLGHVMEADASQTRVIAAARDKHSMVVQGPPGTGKSQTIANIIAVAVRDGQKVLFVAEKRAALDVVHDRLESCGLGPLCLEMHSTKARKKAVYEELRKTLELGPLRASDYSEYQRLQAVRDRLNELSDQLHTVDEVNGETPFGVIGRLAKLIGEKLPRPDYHVEATANWGLEESDAAREEVKILADFTERYGPENMHNWRGANRKMNPMERSRLHDKLEGLREALDALTNCLHKACEALSIGEQGELGSADRVLSLMRHMSIKPTEVDRLVRVDTVMEHVTRLRKLLENIKTEQEVRDRLRKSVRENAFGKDWNVAQEEIARRGNSFLRFLYSDYRAAVDKLKRVVTSPLPKSKNERLKLLDKLIGHQLRVKEIEEQRVLGERALGISWGGLKTDLAGIIEPVQWIDKQVRILGSTDALKRQIDQWPATVNPDELATELSNCVHLFKERWAEVVEMCGFDVQRAFGTDSIDSVQLASITDRVSAWQADPEGQFAWLRLYDTAEAVSKRGLDGIRVRLADRRLMSEHACDTYDYIRAEAIWNRFTQTNPNLSKIDGLDRSRLVEEFRGLDKALLDLSSHEVMSAHYDSIPPGTRGYMGVLRGEVRKKTRHMPLRKLLKKAGETVQAVKPVFLMSPLSVAQYLDPEGLKFDLLLIDEASQVRPADAIGSVMRAERAIVVGDQKQLPPTSFFEKLVNLEEEEDGEGKLEDVTARQIKDMESILTLCEARGMPGCMLEWHYRSQHESLIAVSNQEFYGNQLICPPSPILQGGRSGLTFEFVDGVYRRGRGRSDNPKEAESVMAAVLDHARNRPQETLGVVAMSQSQQTTIQNEAERMRAEYPELNSFCSEVKEMPFFVKNLETVQGDERDVIFISIGYGRTEEGSFFQNFGPVSAEGGERRLNVLFTRAKKRCRVFASIRHTDIQHEKARHKGPRLLKSFLKYAETGEMEIPIITGREPDSPFEEAVGHAITQQGYTVEYQVGSAGFRIDIAVRDPDGGSGYVLAIECDGARYHSSAWARERDRMRQILLEAKGWTFHRIWSTDWFNNPEAETERAVDAIRRACVKSEVNKKSLQPKHPRVMREPPSEQKTESTGVIYKEFRQQVEYTGIDLFEVRVDFIAGLVEQIVEIEGPVHENIVVYRLRQLWGYAHAGKRIREAVKKAVVYAVDGGTVEWCGSDGLFLKKPGATIEVRDRSNQEDRLLRRPEMIAPLEYREAVLRAVRRNIAVDNDECATDVARMFGFRRTGESMKRLVSEQMATLVSEGQLARQSDGTVRINER